MKYNNPIQKQIENDEEAIRWWVDNYSKVYDTSLEYPVGSCLPLLENEYCSNSEILSQDVWRLLKQKNDNEDFVDVMVSIYWWNKDSNNDTLVKLKLKNYEMDFVYLRYVEGLSCKTISDRTGRSQSYLWSLHSRIKNKVKNKIDKLVYKVSMPK